MRNYLFVVVLAVATVGLGQAASAPRPGAGDSKAAAPRRILPDAQIERNIRAKLAKSKMSGTEHFTVSVHDGVATLEGKTNVIQHKGVATRIARTGGAVAVRNHIQVSEEAKAKAAARLAKYREQAAARPVRASVVQPSR